jgi:hypothetical protein
VIPQNEGMDEVCILEKNACRFWQMWWKTEPKLGNFQGRRKSFRLESVAQTWLCANGNSLCENFRLATIHLHIASIAYFFFNMS